MADSTASTAMSITKSRLRARQARRAAKVALSNAQKSHDGYYITHRKTRSETKSFPFLRLPAELRSNVYAHALKAYNRCSINSFRPKPLLQVSEQIRRESIGVATTVNIVDMTVRCSHVVHKKAAIPSVYAHNIGMLQINNVVRNWITTNRVSFRNLNIIANCACHPNSLIGVFHIVLPQNSQRYVVSAEIHPIHTKDERLGVVFGGIQREIERVLGKAAARDGRAEMEFADLEAVAACFRWVEEAEEEE